MKMDISDDEFYQSILDDIAPSIPPNAFTVMDLINDAKKSGRSISSSTAYRMMRIKYEQGKVDRIKVRGIWYYWKK